MESSMTVDLSEFRAATERAYRMGEVRKRDISKVFRDSNRQTIKTAKGLATKSDRGAYSLQYSSRTHTAGALRRGIKFKTSKRYKLVYYVRSMVWYSAIYNTRSLRRKKFGGLQFIERAWQIIQGPVTYQIKDGLGRLTQKEWQNG